MQQVVQAFYLLLNDLRDAAVNNGRGRSCVLGRDGYLRQGNIRVMRNGEPAKSQQPGQHNDDGNHPGEDGAIDEKSCHTLPRLGGRCRKGGLGLQ